MINPAMSPGILTFSFFEKRSFHYENDGKSENKMIVFKTVRFAK